MIPLDEKVQATLTARGCLAGRAIYWLTGDNGKVMVVATEVEGSRTTRMSTGEVEQYLHDIKAPG